MREHMRIKHRRELDMSAQIIGGRVYASVDAFGADGGFDNSMESRLDEQEPVQKALAKALDDTPLA